MEESSQRKRWTGPMESGVCKGQEVGEKVGWFREQENLEEAKVQNLGTCCLTYRLGKGVGVGNDSKGS